MNKMEKSLKVILMVGFMVGYIAFVVIPSCSVLESIGEKIFFAIMSLTLPFSWLAKEKS